MPHFANVVFAGGGSRCFWQAGFWSVYDREGTRTPERVVAVSAGAAMAAMAFSGKVHFGLGYFKEQTSRNRRNFYPRRLLTGEGAFPHERIYRDAIAFVLDPAALAALHAGPQLQIQMAALPGWLAPQLGTVAGLVAYNLEKRLRKPVHPRLGRALGFRAVYGTARACSTPSALVDLILAASSTPPFTPIARYDGQPVLDGGLVDNVPVEPLARERGQTLVLLSRRYPRLPNVPNRTYVQPSSPIRVSPWDYTNPQGLQDAFDLGRKDAEAFLQKTSP